MRKFLCSLFIAATAWFPFSANAEESSRWLDIEQGKSFVLETPHNATVLAVTNPDVADVIPMASANKIQVQGKSVGTTDLVVQLGSGTDPVIYEITVHQDLSDLVRRIGAVAGPNAPKVYPLKDRIVVEGAVSDLETLERVALVASIYDPEFVNLMTVKGDHQVQLEVVFAEVSRTGLRELGVNFLWGNSSQSIGMSGPTSVGGSVLHEGVSAINGGIVPSAAAGTFQVMGLLSSLDLAAVLSVLDDYRMTKVLAQPTIVSLSGQEAEFLAGGEIPIPAPSGQGTISVKFKEYGVKLAFVPTVLANDVIDTQIEVEMSEPDYANSSRITGIEVPGFRTRKSSSHLRIDSGMTFALAGLISEETTQSRAEFPGLGRIPVIGTLFRYNSHSREESELMIFVTPRLVRPLGPGEVPPPPGTTEDNNPSDLAFYFLGTVAKAGSRTTEPTGDIGLAR